MMRRKRYNNSRQIKRRGKDIEKEKEEEGRGERGRTERREKSESK